MSHSLETIANQLPDAQLPNVNIELFFNFEFQIHWKLYF